MDEFDPSKPFTVVDSGPAAAPEFDPSKPFTPVAAAGGLHLPKTMDEMPIAVQAVAGLGDPGAVKAFGNSFGRGLPVVGPAAVQAGLGTGAALGRGQAALMDLLGLHDHVPEPLRGKTLGEIYDYLKTQDDLEQARRWKEYPKASMAGTVLGSASFGNPLAVEAGAGANLTTKVGTDLANAGTGAAGMYTDAVLRGEDQKDADKVGLLTGAIGTAIPAARLVGAAGKAIAPAIADFAENRSASALGMTKGIRNSIGNDAAKEAGRVALDEGVVTPFASTEDKLARMKAVQDRAGRQIGDVMGTLDKAGVKEFTPGDVAMEVDSQLGPTYAGEPLFKGLAGQYENLIDTILKRGDQPITFEEAQNLKKLLGQYAFNEGGVVTGREQAARAYGIVNRELDDAVQRGARQISGSPELLGTLQKAKTNFGASKDALGALESKRAGELGNKFFGLTDTITGSAAAGAGGLVHGGPGAAVVGAGTVLTKKLGEKYGQNVAAWGADRISKMLQAFPQALGKYAPVLQEAEARGPQSLAVTHYLLSQQDPGYQALLESVAGGDKSEQPNSTPRHRQAE